jgi:hypothetical protein
MEVKYYLMSKVINKSGSDKLGLKNRKTFYNLIESYRKGGGNGLA